MATAKAGKVEEGPALARLREKIAGGFAYIEDVMYVGLAAALESEAWGCGRVRADPFPPSARRKSRAKMEPSRR
ncbi:MAG TPA: hypothetical protein VFE97_13615, partial [Methylomirabilota bacterium]|nr:hypothetical protein [Methylomirabilota bacterium]